MGGGGGGGLREADGVDLQIPAHGEEGVMTPFGEGAAAREAVAPAASGRPSGVSGVLGRLGLGAQLFFLTSD